MLNAASIPCQSKFLFTTLTRPFTPGRLSRRHLLFMFAFPCNHVVVSHSTSSYTPCALTSHHRVRCSSGLKQLAKHHSHMTNTPCKALQKSRRGRYSFICPYSSSWMMDKKHGTCLRNGRGCAAWALI